MRIIMLRRKAVPQPNVMRGLVVLAILLVVAGILALGSSLFGMPGSRVIVFGVVTLAAGIILLGLWRYLASQ